MNLITIQNNVKTIAQNYISKHTHERKIFSIPPMILFTQRGKTIFVFIVMCKFSLNNVYFLFGLVKIDAGDFCESRREEETPFN